MTVFLKSILLTGLGVCCLAIGAGAQSPAPVAAPQPARSVGVTGQAAPLATATVQGYPLTLNAAQGGTYVTGFDWNDGEARKIAKQIADAKGEGDREKARDALKTHLEKQFEARQKHHEEQVEALEAQVKKLKDMIGKRKENKREIIDERTKQLVRDAQGLGW